MISFPTRDMFSSIDLQRIQFSKIRRIAHPGDLAGIR